MSINNKNIFTGLFALLSASALFVGSVQAETRGDVPGYVTDSSGEIWRDSSGECWHGSDWTPADATVVGCDGVVLDAPIEVIIRRRYGRICGHHYSCCINVWI